MKIAVVVDPRFPGGTSSAVAAELALLCTLGRVTLHALSTKMFQGTDINPTLNAALLKQNVEVIWEAPIISADVILLHNPACLKFDEEMASRLVSDRLIVVTHDNFVLPDGSESFDVRHCLELIEDAAICRHKMLAPVSDLNRDTITNWRAENECDWTVSAQNWFNICNFEMAAPTKAPKDRRGRLSRPGFEKFPSLTTLETLFPPTAAINAILGADTLQNSAPAHWTLYNFREISPAALLADIDFFVYFVSPNYRESFSRVVAEAISAGKLVITDPHTAANFGKGVIGTTPTGVNEIIAEMVAKPDLYQSTVRQAQKSLKMFSPERFLETATAILSTEPKAS